MWADKHKPIKLDDIAMDESLRIRLHKFVNNMIIPNMIIVGNSGIGKSLILDCVARELYKDRANEYVLKLNSSLDKNVKKIQETLDSFCNRLIVNAVEYKKMIIINNIDNIPQKIQNILAAYIEKYKNIFFTFTCNEMEVASILQSSCVIIHLSGISDDMIINNLIKIVKNEKYKYSEDAMKHLCFLSRGDIRMSINMMQVICESLGSLTIENINKLSDIPNIITLNNIIDNCKKHHTLKTIELAVELYNDGYSCSDILSGLFDVIKMNECTMNENDKIRILTIIGGMSYYVSRKIDSKLQLIRCMIKICESD